MTIITYNVFIDGSNVDRNRLYCQLVSDEGRRQLRSVISRTWVSGGPTATMETGVLPAAGPKLWHSFASDLRQTDISSQRFQRLL